MKNRSKVHCIEDLIEHKETLREVVEALASEENIFLLVDTLNEGTLGLVLITLAFKRLHVTPILITYPHNVSTIIDVFKNLGLKVSNTFSKEDIYLRAVSLSERNIESKILKIIAEFGIHNTLYLGSKGIENTLLYMFKMILEKHVKSFSILKSSKCVIKKELVEHPYPDLVSYVIFESTFRM